METSIALQDKAKEVAGFSAATARLYRAVARAALFARLLNDDVASMDTIDIVCNSMGFAYAQGVIEVLKDLTNEYPIGFGGYYIIAPENACSDAVNVSEWQQIWQYGTDADNTKKWLQDGVAPQCAVGNIGTNRAFIPDDSNIPKGFVESHSIENYWWIFTKTINEKGYVTPRK